MVPNYGSHFTVRNLTVPFQNSTARPLRTHVVLKWAQSGKLQNVAPKSKDFLVPAVAGHRKLLFPPIKQDVNSPVGIGPIENEQIEANNQHTWSYLSGMGCSGKQTIDYSDPPKHKPNISENRVIALQQAPTLQNAQHQWRAHQSLQRPSVGVCAPSAAFWHSARRYAATMHSGTAITATRRGRQGQRLRHRKMEGEGYGKWWKHTTTIHNHQNVWAGCGVSFLFVNVEAHRS